MPPTICCSQLKAALICILSVTGKLSIFHVFEISIQFLFLWSSACCFPIWEPITLTFHPAAPFYPLVFGLRALSLGDLPWPCYLDRLLLVYDPVTTVSPFVTVFTFVSTFPLIVPYCQFCERRDHLPPSLSRTCNCSLNIYWMSDCSRIFTGISWGWGREDFTLKRMRKSQVFRFVLLVCSWSHMFGCVYARARFGQALNTQERTFFIRFLETSIKNAG